MCVVSMVGDYWNKDFKDQWPQVQPWVNPVPDTTTFQIKPLTDYVTKEEFEQLKKEIQELKELLLAAKKYDEATGQPDCEMEEKVTIIKKLADALGVDMKDVFE